MAPSALAKASAGLGWVRLQGAASGGCGGLGLALGPGGDAVHHPGIHPPVRRLGGETPDTGGRPGPVLVCDTPQPPPPPGF